MKKPLIALAAGTALALSIAACDDTATAVEPTTAPLEVTATTTETAPTIDREQIFLDYMAEKGIPADLDLAYAVCDALDAGATPIDLVTIGIGEGIDGNTIGTVIGASIGAFCPEHSDALEEAAEAR